MNLEPGLPPNAAWAFIKLGHVDDVMLDAFAKEAVVHVKEFE
jgi:hypothetical protein